MTEEQAQTIVAAAPELRKAKSLIPTSDPQIMIDTDGQQYMDLKTMLIDAGRREDMGDVMELSKSIERFGVLEPIGVQRVEGGKFRLRYGGRRVQACIIAGERWVPFTFGPEDPILAEESELEENLFRKELNWTEKVAIQERVHQLKVKLHGAKWTLESTAGVLNVDRGDLGKNLKLAAKIKKDPTIKKRLGHLPASAAMRELEREERTTAHQEKIATGAIKLIEEVRFGSCVDLIPTLPLQSIDLWLTDPPFGNSEIEIDKDSTGKNQSYTGLIEPDDNMDAESVQMLMTLTITKMSERMKLGGHFYMFFAFEHYAFLHDKLLTHGFLPEPAPLIWYKEATTKAPQGYSYPPSYEPIIFGHFKERTRRLSGDKMKNVLIYKPVPISERLHPFQKPKKLLAELISRSTTEGDTVLDTFCGSGQTLLAARELKRNAIGFEKNDKNFKRAQLNLGAEK